MSTYMTTYVHLEKYYNIGNENGEVICSNFGCLTNQDKKSFEEAKNAWIQSVKRTADEISISNIEEQNIIIQPRVAESDFIDSNGNHVYGITYFKPSYEKDRPLIYCEDSFTDKEIDDFTNLK